MDSERHRRQMELLINTIEPWLKERYERTGRGAYVGGDMFVYFSIEQVRSNDVRGPDVFVTLDVEPGERKSWVVWDEGKGPDIVIELLSESTRNFDKTGKKAIYQDKLRVPEYYWFDPKNPDDFAGFALGGGLYHPIAPDEEGRVPSSNLEGLFLTRWRGCIHGIEATWLRWCTADGALLPTEAERAEHEAERAEHEAKRAKHEAERAEHEAERAERLARKLRELGIDPEAL
jgi:Uma2 family endonuclease